MLEEKPWQVRRSSSRRGGNLSSRRDRIFQLGALLRQELAETVHLAVQAHVDLLEVMDLVCELGLLLQQFLLLPLKLRLAFHDLFALLLLDQRLLVEGRAEPLRALLILSLDLLNLLLERAEHACCDS